MKRKNIIGLIAMLAIVTIAIFAGCIENEEPVPTLTPTYTPEPTVTPTPSLTETPTPTPTPAPAITITAPTEGNIVSWREIVEGTSEGAYGSELDIYVLVYPIDAGGPWWVQPDVDIFHDGSWEVNCYFGRDPKIHPEDKGARFRIRAIITTQKLREGQQWQKLPDYIVSSETIKVIRS